MTHTQDDPEGILDTWQGRYWNLHRALSAIKSLALTGIVDEQTILEHGQTLKTILIKIVDAVTAVQRDERDDAPGPWRAF